MKAQPLLIALTITNLAMLTIQVAQTRKVEAQGVVPVLRGRSLEIVDEAGRVRASIMIQPAGETNGKAYPDTVMFRLADPNGRPEVKLGASVHGAGLGLVGEGDETQLILKAEGGEASVKLANKGGRQQTIRP